MKGFKGMLADRLPFVVDAALKMCRAKGRYIEHVYKTQIDIYVNKEDKKQCVFKILGKKHSLFDFKRSIDFDNIPSEEHPYWEYVISWVEWLQHNGAFIEECYKDSLDKGFTQEEIVQLFINKYKINEQKAKSLVTSYKSIY